MTTAAKTKVAFPARCAVAIICGEHLLSQVYPAAVPLEAFIDDIVELIHDDLKRRGEVGPVAGASYQLQRVNGVPLDSTKSLDELGVEDGTTLVLAAAESGEVFEPHCESLSTGLARIGKELFPAVTTCVATRTAIAILALVTVTVLGLSGHARLEAESSLPALVVAGLGILLAAGAAVVWRWWPLHEDLLTGLTWLAVPASALGAAVGAPGRLGGPHLFIGALVGLVLTAVGAAATARMTWASTLGAFCALGVLLSAARMWRPIPAQWLGMCTLVGLLVLLTGAPTIALWAARIRPPHFGSITGRDLFRRGDGMPIDAVAPVENVTGAGADRDAPHGDNTPTGVAVAESARRAHAVLTGLCVAAAAALPAAVWTTLIPGQPHGTASALLSGLFVLIFISRARAFAARRQAVPLVVGAAAAVCCAAVRYTLSGTAGSAVLWSALLLVGFAGAGLAAALLVPVTPFTPLVRVVTEWLELVAVVVALPLAAWIGGLFTWVRMR